LKQLTKDERISREYAKLSKIFENMAKDTRSLNDGLVKRASYMLVTLEDYEKDINENGSVESFSQSDKVEPYERERPVARLYNTMNKNYQSIMKQLSDLLPKQETVVKGDGFDDFISERED